MSSAIIVDKLSKRYDLGELYSASMLREVIMRRLKSPFGGQQASKEHIWALEDISFEVGEGEVVGIIGRNGAGKSTLLKLLSRITYATSGDIYVSGRLSALLEVGTGFHEEMTGRENIYLNGSILGMPHREIDSKMDEIVEFSGVGRFLETPIKRYSSGMKLRLGFAVAAHLEPDVLLVDEVLAVGDVQFQKKCLSKLDDLNTGGRTVLFVSHNLGAVENLCSRTIWIDEGKIRSDGPSNEVIREYLGSYAHAHRAQLDLGHLKGRRGNGKCRITGVEFLDERGQPKEVIRSGEAVVTRVGYRVYERVHEPHFGFRLSTDSGHLITDVSTWSFGMEMATFEPGGGSIEFAIDFLNLMPGRYYLTLWIQGVGSVEYDILDDFMTFEVERSDYYRSGRGIDASLGWVFFPGRWQSLEHHLDAQLPE